MTVACFGHKDTPSDIKLRLEREIVRLIEENEDITILVGTHGSFDGMVQKMLKNLAPRYPNMNYHIVLVYYMTKTTNHHDWLPSHSISWSRLSNTSAEKNSPRDISKPSHKIFIVVIDTCPRRSSNKL